jgi:hypothetical protein
MDERHQAVARAGRGAVIISDQLAVFPALPEAARLLKSGLGHCGMKECPWMMKTKSDKAPDNVFAVGSETDLRFLVHTQAH